MVKEGKWKKHVYSELAIVSYYYQIHYTDTTNYEYNEVNIYSKWLSIPYSLYTLFDAQKKRILLSIVTIAFYIYLIWFCLLYRFQTAFLDQQFLYCRHSLRLDIACEMLHQDTNSLRFSNWYIVELINNVYS